MNYADFVTAVEALGFVTVSPVTSDSGSFRVSLTDATGFKWKYRVPATLEGEALAIFAVWVVEDMRAGRRGRVTA